MATDDSDDRTLRTAKWTPYLLSPPGLLVSSTCSSSSRWSRCSRSRCRSGSSAGSSKVDFDWEWGNFSKAFTDFGDQLWRALRLRRRSPPCSASCSPTRSPTSSPSRPGRGANLLLGLVMVPFFTSFLLRTIAWQSLFADNGPMLGVAESLHLDRACSTSCSITTDGKIMNTPTAVIGGLDLQLPAVRAAADLRQPGEDPDQPDRRRQRPLLAASAARSAG